MKRYLIFAFDTYFPYSPNGGLDDIRGSVDTLEEIKPFLEKLYKTTIDEYVDYKDRKIRETYYHGPQTIQIFDCESRAELNLSTIDFKIPEEELHRI